MQLRLDFAVTVSKDFERQDLNEDAWAVDESVTRLAVSDGASESFDSRAWARLLVEKYVQDPHFTPEWVQQTLTEYVDKVDYDSLSWSKQAAFDRGSFATLLGVELALNRLEVEILAIGDSVAFHVSQNCLKASFPYTSAEQFDARPQLLSTFAANNAFVAEPGFFGINTSSTWKVVPGDIILLATDALAQWMLRERDTMPAAVQQLATICAPDEFTKLVQLMRNERRMRIDDSTLIRLVVEEE